MSAIYKYIDTEEDAFSSLRRSLDGYFNIASFPRDRRVFAKWSDGDEPIDSMLQVVSHIIIMIKNRGPEQLISLQEVLDSLPVKLGDYIRTSDSKDRAVSIEYFAAKDRLYKSLNRIFTEIIGGIYIQTDSDDVSSNIERHRLIYRNYIALKDAKIATMMAATEVAMQVAWIIAYGNDMPPDVSVDFKRKILPGEPTHLYVNREVDYNIGRKLNPVEFYELHWRRYARVGALYQDDLRRLDPQLVPAIRSYCQRNGLSAAEFLPESRARRTDLQKNISEPDTREFQKAELTLKKRERARERRRLERQA